MLDLLAHSVRKVHSTESYKERFDVFQNSYELSLEKYKLNDE